MRLSNLTLALMVPLFLVACDRPTPITPAAFGISGSARETGARGGTGSIATGASGSSGTGTTAIVVRPPVSAPQR